MSKFWNFYGKYDLCLVIAALSLGLISVGSCNGDVTSAILQCMIEKSETDLKDTHARFLALGIGLCYLQKQVCFVFS